MKKLIVIALTLCAILWNCQEVNAQLGIGGGLAFGSETSDADAGTGIQVKGIYAFSETWRGAADFIYYLDDIENFSMYELNLNAQYIFFDQGNILAYGLGGINRFSATESILTDQKRTESEMGLNLGVGGQYYFNDFLSANAELKYTLSDFDQMVLSIGIVYGF